MVTDTGLWQASLAMGSDGDLDTCPRGGKSYNPYCRARRTVGLEVGSIDGVHARKQFHISQIDLNGDHVRIVHLGFAENNADAVQHLPDFSFKVLWHLLGFQIPPDLAGHV